MKMITGSKIKNPSDLQVGSVVDQLIDREAQLVSASPVSWFNGQLTFASPIDFKFTLEAGGSYATNRLASGSSPISIANNFALIANLNRTSGTTTLALGTYPGLAAGEYAVVDLSTLNAKDLLRKNHVMLFRREDSGGNKLLYIPFHKQLVQDGASFVLGDVTPFVPTTATYHDPVATTLPTGASYTADGTAVVNNDTVLFSNLSSNNNRIYRVSGVGTSLVWTALPLFNASVDPSRGMYVTILFGTAFNNRQGEFNGTNWKFNDTVRYFNGTDYFETTSLKTSTLLNNTTGNVFTATAIGSENIVVDFSILRNSIKETGNLYITHNGVIAQVAYGTAFTGLTGVTFAADISGGLVRLRYTSDNSGLDATMKYSTRTWSDGPGGPTGIPTYTSFDTYAGGFLKSAFTMSDGSGIEVNCTAPYNVLGKSRIDFTTFTYLVGLNSGTTAGNLEVIVNGQVYPRFLVGVTLDSYYKEIDTDTIEFNTDLIVSSPALSIEVRIRQGTVDASIQTSARMGGLFDAIVGSALQVSQGIATHSTIAQAIADISSGGNITLLRGTYTENVTVNKTLTLEGKGSSAIISGTLTFSAASNASLVRALLVTGNITFQASSSHNWLIDAWQNTASTVTDSGTDNAYDLRDF